MNFIVKIRVKTVICALIKNINILNMIKLTQTKLLSLQSAGISDEKLTPIKDKNSPPLLYEKTKPYLKISFFIFLAQRKICTHKSIVSIYIVYLMADINDVKGSDLLKYGLFGATGYDTNNKLVGYGVGFGTQKYTHEDGKEARNLVILGTNFNALVLEKGMQYPIKSFFCLYIMMLLMIIAKVFCLLMVLNSINLKPIKIKLLLEN